MKVAVKRIHFDAARELVFAAVQLTEPALRPVTATRTYEWDPERRFSQIDAARGVLRSLFSGQAGKKPDVVAFAEYSLPPEAHEAIPFQDLAREHRCIIIAGSYFDARKQGDFFRNNICYIYLPDEEEPLAICKFSPATAEEAFMLSSDKIPNIARLIWEPPGRDEPVSINVFLCRDYLIPFKERPNTSGEIPEDKAERVSLLDWEREGINIILMYNDEPALFESAAGFDIRRTHGKRKLVLLVNSANNDGKLATALIGATTSKKRERDIAAKMPSAMQGVLAIETLLWEVMSRKDDPDTQLIFPIKHWDCYKLSADGEFHLAKFHQELPAPRTRCIFHPAFLAAMQKYIVFEFFVARSTQKIEKAFTDGKIDFVTAGHVRGIEDIVIRRYVEGHSLTGGRPGTIPSLSKAPSLPYSRLLTDEFDEAFDTDPQAPFLRLLIDPREIRKFRGARVDELSERQWIGLLNDITVAAHGREALEEIIRLATDIPLGESIPEKFRSVFSLGTEYVLPFGRNSQIRDTYLLISVENADGSPSKTRFRDFLNANLMDDARVSDIYECGLINVNPEIRRNPFQFLLRLRCSVFDADDILSLMQSWANRAGVRVGTRSYDVWKSIKHSATRGIVESTITQEEGALQKALFTIDPDFAFQTREMQEKFAEAISSHTRLIKKIRSAKAWNGIIIDLNKFLHYVCVYNCVNAPTKKEQYRESAAGHWNQLYKFPESASRLLLIDVLKLPKDTKRDDILRKLMEADAEYFKKSPQAKDAGFLKWFADLYDEVSGEKSALSKMTRRVLQLVSGLRNLAVHGGVGDDLDASITIGGYDWQSQFETLDEKVEGMCQLIVKFASELHRKGLET